MPEPFDPTALAGLFAAACERRPAADFPLPGTAVEAMAVQAATMGAEDGLHAGYKVALSPEGSPVSGRLRPLVEAEASSVAQLPWRAGVRVEVEVAVRLGSALPPRPQAYSRDEVSAAIAGFHLGVEILDSRIEEGGKAPFLLFLADRLGNAGYVLGPALPRDIAAIVGDMALNVRLDGASLHSGPARHPAGDVLAWLIAWANDTERSPDTLRASQIVTTGSLCGALEVERRGLVLVTLGALGERIAIHFE